MIPLRDNITAKTIAIINWLLIAANVYVFTLELRMHNPQALEAFVLHWGVVPSKLWLDLGHYWTTLVTAEFLHAGWMHLIGNMLFLFVFGRSVEDRMGHLRYLLFYLVVGAFANGFEAFTVAHSTIPLLGASGAIAGVLGAYFFYYPYARILTLIPIWIFSKIIEIPAFIFLGFWFLLQAFNGTASLGVKTATAQNMGGVAWWAHAAGFVAGLIAAPALSQKKGKTR